jgi:hypothetical protein
MTLYICPARSWCRYGHSAVPTPIPPHPRLQWTFDPPALHVCQYAAPPALPTASCSALLLPVFFCSGPISLLLPSLQSRTRQAAPPVPAHSAGSLTPQSQAYTTRSVPLSAQPTGSLQPDGPQSRQRLPGSPHSPRAAQRSSCQPSCAASLHARQLACQASSEAAAHLGQAVAGALRSGAQILAAGGQRAEGAS